MTAPAQVQLDLVAAAVMLLDGDGRIRSFNRACAPWLIDRPGGQVTSFWQLLPQEVGSAAHQRFLARDFPIRVECDLVTRGEQRRIAWTLAVGGRETIAPVVATGVDITEWQRRIDALSAHEERLRTLLNAMPDPVFLKDGEDRWAEVNEAALDVFGLRGVDYRGRTDAELAISDFYREALRYCAESEAKAWSEGTISRSEEVMPRPDGTSRVYDTYKVPLFHPDGRRKGFVILGRDISKRVQAEAALHRSEEWLRKIVDTTPELIGVVNSDGTICFVNSSARTMLGVDPDTLLGRSFEDPQWQASSPDGRPLRLDEQPFRMARTRGPVTGIEIALVRPDGRRAVLAVNAAPIDDPPGAVVFAATDVTRRNEVEQLKTRFLKISSHELRTPLTPLRLLLQHAQEQLARGILVDRPAIDSMERQTRRLTHLVNELLDVARLEADTFIEGERVSLDLRALASEVVADFRIQAPARRLVLDVPPTAVPVCVDRVAIEQVLSNLVDNALKYSTAAVEVRVSVQDEMARVAVHDQGPGIAPEHEPGLFTRFYRVSSDATVRQPGLGLGLYVCRELVHRHGGGIGYRTEVGQGSTFSFTLPISR